MKTVKLNRTFYAGATLDVAHQLLGKILIYKTGDIKLGGRLVEVEAYIGEDDPACHACRGMTPRNAIMYDNPGFLYVYFTYGNHNMLNIVTESKGFPAAVLLRGMEPLFGVEQMMLNRGVDDFYNIASGPGKMAKSLGLTTQHNGLDVTQNEIYVVDDGYRPEPIWCSSRIGIGDNGSDKLWRFFIDGNKHVSKPGKQIRESCKLYR